MRFRREIAGPENLALPLFRRHFGCLPTHRLSIPDPVELLGDFSGSGLSVSVAADPFLHLAFSTRSGGKIEWVHEGFSQPEIVSLDALDPSTDGGSWSLAKAALFQLKKIGIHFVGFNAALSTGQKLATTAQPVSLILGILGAIRTLHPFGITEAGLAAVPRLSRKEEKQGSSLREKLLFARMGQAVGGEFSHTTFAGFLTLLAARSSHAVEIDSQDSTFVHLPMAGDITLVACETGLDRDLHHFQAWRRLVDESAQALGVRSLRSLDTDEIRRRHRRLTQRQFQCALNYAAEIRRAICGGEALRSGDFEQFGQYMFQSQEAARELQLDHPPEIDLLVNQARIHPACLGARASLQSVRRATVNLVKSDRVDLFCEFMTQEYRLRTGKQITARPLRIVGGIDE